MSNPHNYNRLIKSYNRLCNVMDKQQMGGLFQHDNMEADLPLLMKDPNTTEVEVGATTSPSTVPSDRQSSGSDAQGSDDDEYLQMGLNHDPRLSFDFFGDHRIIPDLTQERMHKIPGIMHIYNAYRRAYSNPFATKEDHIKRACTLAITLLEHYFPPKQRFTVEPVLKNPTVGNYGWSIELKPAGKGGFPGFRHIPPEQITGFMVSKFYDLQDGAEQSFPHTYLTILIDDIADLDNWQLSTMAQNTRGDIMSYSMGVQAKIDQGYGIVIIGPLIEFYKYDNSASKPMQRIQKDNWAFDMRTAPPGLVDQTFEFLSGKTVVYQNGILGGGSTRRP